jgi:hypothetical protein
MPAMVRGFDQVVAELLQFVDIGRKKQIDVYGFLGGPYRSAREWRRVWLNSSSRVLRLRVCLAVQRK